ncbi:exo-beta-N-acetylmuramidase NamZ domain-containing protein [Streptomyces sp. NPDC056401]|uniref:exo-beta-N-acetylmuramidase NamZ family protein n=1 Tax=Streptomyces sp. NPDC056401 TaxID=3345809 RepID=UPI0035E20D23
MTLSRRGLLGLAGAAGAAGALGAGTRETGARGAGALGAGARAAGVADGRVRTGFERLAADGYAVLAGQRVGVVTNPTGITADARHLVDVLHADAADGHFDLVAVFGPEHGFRGTAQAGGSEGAGRDPATGLPVYDTYGKSGQGLADVFTAAGVDTVVFDIQDVGARFYTYIWTLYDCMRAAALAGKAVVVLDRPNPVGARRAAGPVLQRPYASFVGREPIALAHGMTAGELAGLFAGEFLRGAGAAPRLEVVRMAGWRRESFFEETGLPWVPPSPNMPTPGTALAYAGTCLFEGTNLSEGRGTTTPFELIGAEGVDRKWAEAANALELPGVWFREAYFTPSFSKYAGKTCGGVRLLVHDREAFDPVRAGIGLLVTARQVWSGFAWRSDQWIDRLTGSDRVRRMVDAGAGVEEIAGDWAAGLAGFAAAREQYLLYP